MNRTHTNGSMNLSLIVKMISKIQEWYSHLGFMELSREIAYSWYQAGRSSIDFGDLSLEEFVKYYCRDNTKHAWYRYFVSYKELKRELDLCYLREQYE